jgi:hypothetical protein
LPAWQLENPQAVLSMLSRDRSSLFLVLLTWLLASLAALSHGCIDLVGTLGAGGEAYDDHAHGTVAPIGLAALALIVALVWRSATLRIGRAESVDPALLLARRFGALSPRRTARLRCCGWLRNARWNSRSN